MKITILGGTGYAGSHIAEEAASRGHQVTAVSRRVSEHPITGVNYLIGDVLDNTFLGHAISGADVVVSAISARGNMLGKVIKTAKQLISHAGSEKFRIGIIGGAGSLQIFEGGPRLYDNESFTAEFKPEALEMTDVWDELIASEESLDWFYLSPAASFGPFSTGQRTGQYRVGKDVLVTDADGNSNISGADLGVAVLDEIEQPKHSRTRFTIAY